MTEGSAHGGHGGGSVVVVVVVVSTGHVHVVCVDEDVLLVEDELVLVVVRVGRGIGVQSWTAFRGVTTWSPNWSCTALGWGTGGLQRSR